MSVGRGRQLDLEVTDPVELGEDSGQGVLGLVSGCGFGVGIEEIVDGFEKRFEESEERLGALMSEMELKTMRIKESHSRPFLQSFAFLTMIERACALAFENGCIFDR
ncbi:hypothetical protein OIU78_028907 [Salix suchowensis]|uniref:Uncharacterized protein n=1 Tax=Salix udensis TaxID=889485 RepID=A0AAD6KD79_9ROSI|nr:hypothetical protein OIU78_028907 [Salix suchowensis]KAJ6421217.1 hypothetical protein OIU84_028568 [Salix udensis]